MKNFFYYAINPKGRLKGPFLLILQKKGFRSLFPIQFQRRTLKALSLISLQKRAFPDQPSKQGFF
jgi:hypothetical protein